MTEKPRSVAEVRDDIMRAVEGSATHFGKTLDEVIDGILEDAFSDLRSTTQRETIERAKGEQEADTLRAVLRTHREYMRDVGGDVNSRDAWGEVCRWAKSRLAHLDSLADAPAEAGEMSGESRGSWCPECGPHVGVDEDGCCASCGCQAHGKGADEALVAMKTGEHRALCAVAEWADFERRKAERIMREQAKEADDA